MNKLNEIQQKLKAPKNQTNAFGKYKYRSCEDILEAVKPLLGEATLVVQDEIVMIGDRYYVKATATLKEGKESESATASAREPQEKKGMDTAQITGATSSYARKYALDGLFCIDDTKDADTQDNTQEVKKKDPQASTLKDIGLIFQGWDEEMKELFKVFVSEKYKTEMKNVPEVERKNLLELMKKESFKAFMEGSLESNS